VCENYAKKIVTKPDEKGPLARPRCRREGILLKRCKKRQSELDSTGSGYSQWQGLPKLAMNLQVPKRRGGGNFLTT
jgi:hypothetical protein